MHAASGGLEQCGLILELETLAFHDNTGSSHFPSQPQMSGRLRMLTSDQFAAFLLDLPIQIDQQREVVEVVAYVMEFQDILPSRVILTGKVDDIPNLIATAEKSPFSIADDDDDDPDQEDPGLAEGGRLGEDNGEFETSTQKSQNQSIQTA
jgi:hypothetical protein